METLAAADLVWAKSKGRPWWPARLRPDSLVSYLPEGDPDVPTRPANNLKRFADPAADHMARASAARAFVAAVHDAHSHAVGLLQAHLTCACASDSQSPPPPPLTIGVVNLTPPEFLDALRHAALDVSSVGLVDLARLKSWARALAQGWGPAGAGHYPRRAVDDLVDKIDLDVLAGEDRDWAAQDQDNEPFQVPQETPAQKKRSVAALMEDMDGVEEDDSKGNEGNMDDDKGNEGSTSAALSNKRERKKSKYLSPPYTNLAGAALVQKVSDLPKALLLSAAAAAAAEDETKVLPDNVGAEEVLLFVRGSGKDVFYRARSLKATKAFLGLFRSSVFVEDTDYESYNAHKCPAENASAKAGADVSAGLVSDSHLALKKGKCVLKRSRKNDQDGSGSSSIKTNKREKISPAAALGCGVSITPAIPIRQMRAEDIRRQMKPGFGASVMEAKVQPEKKKKSVLNSPISASVVQAIKPGHQQDQANGDSVLKTAANVGNNSSDQSAKENDEAAMEATQSETNIQADTDVLVRSVPMESAESEANIPVDTDKQSAVADVTVRSVPMESTKSEANIPVDTDKQSAVADVTVRSELLPPSGDNSLSRPTDENKEQASVEVRTVQESYASLEAMVPEMLKNADVTNGSTVAAVSHALKDEGQRVVEQLIQKKMTDGVSGNHSSGEAPNGSFPDLANSTPKKKKKKTAQHFGNPAALLLDFAQGVILPSKERLLSEFRRFGFVIESETEIVEDTHSARVVFGKSAEAEAAYNNADTLGKFGPPFATPRLHYLPPIKLSAPSPSPASKPPLVDIRKNLEKMISSLSGSSTLKKATSSDGSKPAALLGEMQGLLAKVDKLISGPSTSTPH